MFDLFGMLYAPGEFIRRCLKKPLAFKLPLVIVLVAAAAGLLSNLLAGEKWFARLMDQMPANVPELESQLKSVKVGMVLQNVFGALEFPLMWVIGTGILNCVAILLEGEVDFRRLLQLTGFAHLAPACFGLVAILFAMTWKPQFTINAPDPRARPEVFSDAVNDAIRGEVHSTNFRYLAFLKWAFLAWMGVMQVMAIKATSKLSWGKSVACLASFGVLYGISQLLRSLASAGGI